MPTFKFICEHRDYHSDEIESTNTVEFNKESLYDVIEEFERFLKGAGFVFEGQLEFVKDEPTVSLNDLSSEDLTFNFEGAAFTDDFVIPSKHSSLNINLNDNMSSTVSIDSPDSVAWPFPKNERP